VWVCGVAVWFRCFIDACPARRQAWLLEACFYLSSFEARGPSDLLVIGSQVFLGASLEALACLPGRHQVVPADLLLVGGAGF